MKVIRFAAAFLALFVLVACTQTAWINKNTEETGRHTAGSLVFAVNYAMLSSNENAVLSQISVNFDSEQLFHQGNKSGFTLYMYVKSRSDSLIFQQTRSFALERDSSYNFSWEIPIPRNTEGTIQIKINDRFSQYYGITERRFSTVQKYGFFVSGPALGVCLPAAPASTFQPRPSHSFSHEDSVLCVFINEHNLPLDAELEVTVSSALLKFSRSVRTKTQPDSSIYVWLPIDDLRVAQYVVHGEYRLEGEVIGEWEKEIAFPWQTAYRRAGKKDILRLLRYITTPKEFKILKKHDDKEFFAKLEEFWKFNDPVPATPQNEFRDEFFRRVELANQRYSTINYNNGWQSDRGRILIKYGEPSDIEYHPFDFGQPAYEIWYYYTQQLTFYFVDRKGINQFELYNTWTEGK